MSARILLIALGGLCVVLVAFVGTTLVLNWLMGPPDVAGQPLLGKTIVTSGGASASTRIFQADTSFQFKGNGFARIEGTKGLNCLTHRCNLSATVEFASANPSGQAVIVGQSYAGGEQGWHLIWIPGQLYLQPDGGGPNQIAAAFTPNPGERYEIDIVNKNSLVTMSINGATVGATKEAPFKDIARDLTIGGRDGPSMNAFTGKVSHLAIAETQ
jgi:hypothetical protein